MSISSFNPHNKYMREVLLLTLILLMRKRGQRDFPVPWTGPHMVYTGNSFPTVVPKTTVKLVTASSDSPSGQQGNTNVDLNVTEHQLCARPSAGTAKVGRRRRKGTRQASAPSWLSWRSYSNAEKQKRKRKQDNLREM